MIVAWMLYTIAVTLLLLAGATAAEYVARAVRAPTRAVWAAAMVVALGLSARAIIVGLDTRRETLASASNAVVRAGVGTLDGTEFAAALLPRDMDPPGLMSRVLGAARATVVALGRLEQSGARVDPSRFDRWNGMLVGLWMAASTIVLSLLFASLIRLRRIERRLTTRTVSDHPVLVSHDLGPAVLGVLRSRVVLPEWVLTLPGRERDAILAHEREHAAAYDPALITAAMFVVALQPWNIALWGLIGRLRVALEADCDRRVLDTLRENDGRWYGRLLILVYERTTLGPSLGIGFVARPSNLERRINRIVLRPRMISMGGVTSLFVSAMLVVTACRASAPVRQEQPSLVVEKTVPLPVAEEPAPLPGEYQSRSTAAAAEAILSAARTLMSAARDSANPPDKRCSLAARRAELPSGQHAVLWPGQWPVNAGCSIKGDIVVVHIDSTNVLVAARDTADVGITAFFVFQTEPGTTTSDLVWSTTTGRAELNDTTMSFISPAEGTKPLVLRLRATPGSTPRTDVIELKIDQMMMAEMQGIPWETIAQLPASRRCTATERESEMMADVGQRRSSPGVADEMQRACFVTRGSRFQFSIFNSR